MAQEVEKYIQGKLAQAGFYDGDIDGVWGPLSDDAFDKLLSAAKVYSEVSFVPPAPGSTSVKPQMAWGAKVSPLFKERVLWIGQDLDLDPDDLMSCIAWESGETFKPDIKNAAGSGATGLIQFMPSTARSLGTTTEALARMTAEDQLNFVYKYFRPYKGKLKTLGDIYMAILWPLGVGKSDDFVLFDKNDARYPKRYLQNKGLDTDANGKVTKREAYGKVQAKLTKGLGAGYYG